MKTRIGLLTLAGVLMLGLSCDCDSSSEPAFKVDQPLNNGDAWFYTQTNPDTTNPGDMYIDTVMVVGQTNYNGIPAVLLFSTHAKDTAKQETTVAFYRGPEGMDTLYHYSKTTGFFPDTINYNGETYYITFDHDHMEIAWLPRKLDLGDQWNVAYDSGVITKASTNESYHLTATVNAVFDSVLSVSFDDRFYGYGHLEYPNAIRVIYTGNLEFEGVPITLTIGKSWWVDGTGEVKHWAYSTDSTGAYDPLEEVLLDYTGDN